MSNVLVNRSEVSITLTNIPRSLYIKIWNCIVMHFTMPHKTFETLSKLVTMHNVWTNTLKIKTQTLTQWETALHWLSNSIKT